MRGMAVYQVMRRSRIGRSSEDRPQRRPSARSMSASRIEATRAETLVESIRRQSPCRAPRDRIRTFRLIVAPQAAKIPEEFDGGRLSLVSGCTCNAGCAGTGAADRGYARGHNAHGSKDPCDSCRRMGLLTRSVAAASGSRSSVTRRRVHATVGIGAEWRV